MSPLPLPAPGEVNWAEPLNESLDQLNDKTVVGGRVVGDNLILESEGGLDILAGDVRGRQGDEGEPGPPGPPGAAANITSASASSVPNGTPPSVELGGTSSARTFTFLIPDGAQGPQGDPGDQGPPGIPGAGSVSTVNGDAGPNVVITPASIGAVPTSQAASTTQAGIARLTTTAEANAGSSTVLAVNPSGLRFATAQRYERVAASAGALGSGAYTGQTALVTLTDYPITVVWTGARWEPISWRLSGTATQMTAVQSGGLGYRGMKWLNTTDGIEYLHSGSAWLALDSGWLAITLASPFTGSASARLLNNVVYLTGGVTHTTLTGGSYTTFGTLPGGIPAPATTKQFTHSVAVASPIVTNINVSSGSGAVGMRRAATQSLATVLDCVIYPVG